MSRGGHWGKEHIQLKRGKYSDVDKKAVRDGMLAGESVPDIAKRICRTRESVYAYMYQNMQEAQSGPRGLAPDADADAEGEGNSEYERSRNYEIERAAELWPKLLNGERFDAPHRMVAKR